MSKKMVRSRVRLAKDMIKEYAARTGSDTSTEEAIHDLVADLMHLASARGYSFEDILASAEGNCASDFNY